MARTYNDEDGATGGGVNLSFPRITPVVKALLIVNIALGVLFLLTGDNLLFAEIHRWFALDASRWRELAPLVPLWQLVTCGFLHDTGDTGHLLMNMIALVFFGAHLETLMGSRRFAIFYFLAIVIPASLQLVVDLALDHKLPMVGASGAIMAVTVALAVLRPHMVWLFFFVPMKLWVMATIFVALDVIGSVRGGDNVAHFVHLSGALLGFAAAKLGWLWFDPVAAWRSHKAERRVEDLRSDEQKLDELLGRIHAQGIGSLSRGERAFLKRMSARRGG